ncbi:AAA family ATPase [Roseivirga misakiensis]|uniref:Adenylate kinase n=1 Tax=Roseivirga misakiensis TaxID=1563681 RepID=A0A1E5SLH5_9BACT|nr:AAA family ATPase [Roseivirga misakiensis]OEJ99977.1 hypothetical protein BFP71_10565 [Roseivirga misakiensis]
MAKLILIFGVSRSGKSSLAKQLSKDLSNCFLIHLDEWIVPEHQLPKIKDRIDWEKPETIDWLRINDLIMQGIKSHNYVIIEGIFALSIRQLAEKADFTIQLELEKEEFFTRRNQETRWGKEPKWFIEHVWQSHLKYSNPHNIKPSITIKGIYTHQYTDLTRKIGSAGQ